MGTREDIVAAAARIMRAEGYARATTKEIARAAGYSEAALYKHFTDKTEIFLSVLSEQSPALGAVLTELLTDARRRSSAHDVDANLVDVATTALEFYLENFPISMSLFSSRALLTTHRERIRQFEYRAVHRSEDQTPSTAGAEPGGTDVPGAAGPHWPLRRLAEYLRVEQRAGRVSTAADTGAVAALLLGGCFQQAFLYAFDDERPTREELREHAAHLVVTLWAGLS